MSDHIRITIYYNNHDEQDVVIDATGGVREDDSGILLFGRTDSDEWYPLVKAPRESVRSWS